MNYLQLFKLKAKKPCKTLLGFVFVLGIGYWDLYLYWVLGFVFVLGICICMGMGMGIGCWLLDSLRQNMF